ncbi:MAG: Hsp20/alpha crystallin family protein [Desulfovibrionaceae bacterium]|nr:Hsp20/alpha crystallin family protein [Desulfovibrionaceae bacterium]MBF0513100.1 Hsp20/alpha crystallin family protein [Desulfovibrionaceae bacterium]
MAKLNWNPWAGMDEVKDELGRIISQASGRPVKRVSESGYLWTPAADVLETPVAIVIRVELAGVEREDVVVEARGQSVWVFGERRFDKDPHGGVYQALERSYGPFARRFALCEDADRQGIGATFAGGLLEIVIPKMRPKAAKRRIPIE